MITEVISREEAKSIGIKHYYTGKPCKYGHDSPRLVSTTRCIQCIKEYKEKFSERESAYRKKYKEDNPTLAREYYLRKKAVEEPLRLEKQREKESLRPLKEEKKKARKRLRDKEYRNNNKDKRKDSQKAYYSSYKGRLVYKANGHKRRATLKEQGGTFTLAEIEYMELFYNNECPICSEWIGEDYHIDHVQPIAKGGDNFATNLQLLCPSCNLSKGDTTMKDWLADEVAYNRWALQRFAMLVGLTYVCSKEKEDAFEEFLKSKFKELEKDYDGLPKTLKEIHGTKSKENTE